MTLSRFIAIILISNPILAIYGIGLSTVSILDISLLLSVVFIFFQSFLEKKIEFKKTVFFLLLPIIFSYIFLFNSIEESTFHLRTYKYLFYTISIGIVTPKTSLIDLIKTYKVVAILACLFLIFQYISLILFNFYPKGYIEGIPLLREELASHSEIGNYESWFRPRSFFGEPSQFGIFVGSLLVIHTTVKRKFDKLSYFIALSLLISFSGTAYILLALSIILTTIKNIKKLDLIILSGLFVPTSVFLIARNNFGPQLLKRLIRRTEAIFELFEKFNGFDLVRGNGMVGRTTFMSWPNSLTLYFYYFGIFGVIFFLLFLLSNMKYNNSINIVTLLLILTLSLGTEFLVSQQILLLFPILLKTNEDSMV